MVCYVCNKQGKETPAVAICIVCGMALCPEHLIREELPVWEKVFAGMGETTRKLPETLPRILCAPCHSALKQTAK
jgi:hypothetical protein